MQNTLACLSKCSADNSSQALTTVCRRQELYVLQMKHTLNTLQCSKLLQNKRFVGQKNLDDNGTPYLPVILT